jgi:CubicO group peptidase (beta-lactamase class C family)
MKTKAIGCAVIQYACCALAILSWGSCTQKLPVRTTRAFSAQRIDKLNAFLDTYQKNFGTPGIAVSIVSKDSVYQTALGQADGQGAPFTISTNFLAGSISEPMLAMAALKLADEGRIDLDEPVVNYLPYFKMGGKSYTKITVRHLLTHTSGIPHYNMMWDMPNNKANAPEVTTRSIATQQPDFAVPGSKVKRSPYNYDILADLISKVTGKPFEAYVSSHIFEPLNMGASSYLRPKATAQPFHTVDWLTYRIQQDTIYPYNRENGGSGGLHTNATDMSRWMYALLENATSLPSKGTIAPSLLKEATSVQFKTKGNKAVGFGWEIDTNNGKQILTKGSRYGGFADQVILMPDDKIGVMVSSNISDPDLDPTALARLIAAWLNGKPLITPKVPVSMAMNQALARTGSINKAFNVFIEAKNSPATQYDISAAILSQFGMNLLHRVHDKQKALQAFQFCVQQYPRSAYAQMNLAEGYIFAKDAANTRKAIDAARSLPDDSGLKASYLAYLKENLEILEEKKG